MGGKSGIDMRHHRVVPAKDFNHLRGGIESQAKLSRNLVPHPVCDLAILGIFSCFEGVPKCIHVVSQTHLVSWVGRCGKNEVTVEITLGRGVWQRVAKVQDLVRPEDGVRHVEAHKGLQKGIK